MVTSTDAASKLPPNQMREIREAFQVLDRDNDGLVNKDDVADVLTNLGTLPVAVTERLVVTYLNPLQAKIRQRLRSRDSSRPARARLSTSRLS